MRALTALIFVSVALSVTGAVHYYLWARLIRDPGWPPPFRWMATVLLLFLWLSIPLSIFASRALPLDTGRLLVFVPYLWMGTMLFLFFLTAGFDVARLLFSGFRRIFSDAPLDPQRRHMIAQVGALAIAGFAGGMSTAATRIAALRPIVKRLEVPLTKLHSSFNGLSLVQLSDIHIGLTLNRDWLEAVVDDTMALRPDLIVITGDLVDGPVERLLEHVRPLERLKAAHGVYFVTGNHEYYSGVEEWLPAIESLGIRVLRNERVTLEQNGATLELAGIDDYNARGMAPGHGPDLSKALAGRDPSTEVILLAHQPKAAEEASRHDVGLLLSGHTHGGQIWPFQLFVYLQQPYLAGLHRHGPRTKVYVNQGTGFWGPPMRLGTMGEITHITLLSA